MAIKLSGSTIIDDSRNIVNAGIVTATSFDGDGSSLTNIVTSITAGTGISIDQSTGQVTISSDRISLSDLSVTQNAAGTAALSYDNTSGVFSYTPPDLSSYLTSYTVTSSDLGSISIDALSDVDTSSTSPTDGQALLWNGANSKWEPGTVSSGGGGGSSTFLGLSDTPGSFTASKYLAVNSGGTAIEFVDAPSGGSGGSSTFLGLSDTPASFGTAGQVLAVNSGGTALEFVTASSGGGSSGISVGTRTGSTDNDDLVTGVTELRFAKAPFTVTDLGSGKVLLLTESSFNPIRINGSGGVTASGEEELNLVAGSGVTITADNTSTPKSITISASGGGGGGGGATTLGDLTDVTLTNPSVNQVLKYTGTVWTNQTDATGSGGGGGGGGDGTAPLGTNPRGSYAGGLKEFQTTTQINDAIDQLNIVMALLAPPAPPNLSTRTIDIVGFYNAINTATGESGKTTDSTRPTSTTVQDFYDGDAGDLKFLVDGTVDGTITLTDQSEQGSTDGGLTITADVDPYASSNTQAGFWTQLSAKGQSSTALSVGDLHTYQLSHTITGSTNAVEFLVDQPGTATISNESVDTSAAEAAVSYVSGVPTYSANSTVAISFDVDGAITKAYSANKIADITNTNINSGTITPASEGYTEGQTISISGKTVSFRGSRYAENLSVAIKGYNSKTSPGTTTTLSIPGRLDTKSNESSRITSGSGQYPTAGYGGSYNSSDSLANNEELQLLNNKYVYPSTDYSSVLSGPNYSGLSGQRYVTFNAGGIGEARSAGSFPTQGIKFTINQATGFNSTGGGSPITAGGITINVKVDAGPGQTGTTGWIDANAPHDTVSLPDGDGDICMVFGSSSPTEKRITFGNVGRSGTCYIRIGLPAGSTATLSGVSITEYV